LGYASISVHSDSHFWRDLVLHSQLLLLRLLGYLTQLSRHASLWIHPHTHAADALWHPTNMTCAGVELRLGSYASNGNIVS